MSDETCLVVWGSWFVLCLLLGFLNIFLILVFCVARRNYPVIQLPFLLFLFLLQLPFLFQHPFLFLLNLFPCRPQSLFLFQLVFLFRFSAVAGPYLETTLIATPNNQVDVEWCVKQDP